MNVSNKYKDKLKYLNKKSKILIEKKFEVKLISKLNILLNPLQVDGRVNKICGIHNQQIVTSF